MVSLVWLPQGTMVSFKGSLAHVCPITSNASALFSENSGVMRRVVLRVRSFFSDTRSSTFEQGQRKYAGRHKERVEVN